MLLKFLALLKHADLPRQETYEITKHLRRFKFLKSMPPLVKRSELPVLDGITRSDFKLDQAEFEKFIANADYENRFPKYIEEFGEPRQPPGVLMLKYSEQFLSLAIPGMDNLSKEDILVDVAASNGPFQAIMQGLGYANTYKTDLNFRTSEKDKIVGCNANDLSYFANGSVTLIVSHNSWEHFEGSSDIDFLHECARILKPGGKVLITPLYLHARGVNTTDPAVWETKYRNAPEFPVFDKEFAIHLKHHKQRLEKYYDPKSLAKALGPVGCDFEIVCVEGAPNNEMILVGTKPRAAE